MATELPSQRRRRGKDTGRKTGEYSSYKHYNSEGMIRHEPEEGVIRY